MLPIKYRPNIFLYSMLLLALLLSACDSSQSASSTPPLPTLDAVDLNIVTGQKVFVPAYSEIFYNSSRLVELTTTLAIHNSDPDDSIIITSVRYYDTNGALVRELVEAPTSLAPMATTGFVIDGGDTSAGWGANFMVEWGAENPVYEPVIEAVMIMTQSNQGISFISPGRVVWEQSSEQE